MIYIGIYADNWILHPSYKFGVQNDGKRKRRINFNIVDDRKKGSVG